IAYPALSCVDILVFVEQFYGEFYFRPRVVWRVLRKALFHSEERKRLYHEAREYLELRSKRKKMVAERRSRGPAALPDPAGD
ncbi:MAG: hopanoid biosynthesis associated radical SAM protein HpnJ, partial [Acidobacteria bacterium]|nr:hopanoid biosynthesis associated radical SAM protein HpnJ [Acidobacteriota bacterium]